MVNIHSKVLEKHGGIDIFVHGTNGKTVNLTVHGDESIFSVRRKVSQKHPHNMLYSSDQYLTYQSKPLTESLTVADYGIQQGSTLFASERRRGGCFMISLSIIFTIFCAIAMSLCTCGLSLTIIPFLLPLLCILPLFCL